jgi:RND superfamily putative drug exporter
LSVTGGVISSAGIVLAATFAVLMLAPLVAFVQIGFVVAAGILIDTLLVRSVLVPALALAVGPRFWWPSTLPSAVPLTGPPPALSPTPEPSLRSTGSW